MLWRVLPSEKRSHGRERPAVTGAGTARRETPSAERRFEKDDVAEPGQHDVKPATGFMICSTFRRAFGMTLD
ncbi:hypothetical protein MTO96_010934 [Rhipicephalus appendiculatus]